MTRLFLDTEFVEDGRTIDLVSIGMVTDEGRELYLQNANADLTAANEWVRTNVLPKLAVCPKGLRPANHRTAACGHDDCVWVPKYILRSRVMSFVEMCAPEPEIWGYYADYDWVVVCQLFGQMADLPTGWPMYCRDLKQLCDSLGNPRLPEEGKGEHNALADAQWNRTTYYWLQQFHSTLSNNERQEFLNHARRKEPRPVDQESGTVRSAEGEAGDAQVAGSGDQQRQFQQEPVERQEGRRGG